MNKYVQWLAIIGGSVAMLACTVMQPLSVDPPQLQHALKPGDQVEVTTTSGQKLQFTVASADAQGLHGGGQNIAYNDIQGINRKEISAARTTWLVLGVLAAGGVAAAAGGGGGHGGGSGGGGY
jgi:hypothetical protein